MEGAAELIGIQILYIIFLFLIIRAIRIMRKREIFYWAIVGLYGAVLLWLGYNYVRFPTEGNGGLHFAIGMYSIILPGLLVLLAIIVFVVGQVIKEKT